MIARWGLANSNLDGLLHETDLYLEAALKVAEAESFDIAPTDGAAATWRKVGGSMVYQAGYHEPVSVG